MSFEVPKGSGMITWLDFGDRSDDIGGEYCDARHYSRGTGQVYDALLESLAKASGIANSALADLAQIDKKRPNKGLIKDWMHPAGSEARITMM